MKESQAGVDVVEGDAVTAAGDGPDQSSHHEVMRGVGYEVGKTLCRSR